MKVLSLFDGMACGMLAMQQANVCVCDYDAYEIDKYAIKTAQHNFPEIKEHGDVFTADFTQYAGVDYLIGGSPCTHWSIAQTKNRETTVQRDEKGEVLLHSSGIGFELFSQYLRALEEAKPRFFIYENNKSMSKEIRQAICDCFGFEPICINSALVSAQNRQRLYWVGKRNADGTYSKVNVEQPEDKGILLKDVLDSAVTWRDKAHTIDAQYFRSTGVPDFTKQRTYSRIMAAEPVIANADDKAFAVTATYYKGGTGEYDVSHNLEKHKRSMVAEPIQCLSDSQLEYMGRTVKDGRNHWDFGHHFDSNQDKAHCITANVSKVIPYNVMCERIPDYVVDKSRPLSASYSHKGDGEGSLKCDAFPDNPNKQVFDYVAESVPLSEKEIDYMVRDHQEQRWSFLNKPGEDDKSKCVVANISKGVPYNVCAEPLQVGAMPRPNGELSTSQAFRVYDTEAKSVTLKAQGGGAGAKTGLYAIPYAIEFDENGKPVKAIGKDGKKITVYEVKDGQITIKGKQYPIKLKDGFYIIRKLTVSECKRLQTVPEWYEFPVSDSQAYKMLGNGWTVDVIAWLIDATKNEDKKERIKEMELKVNAIALPEQAISFNYEELKQELLQKAEFYATVVYSEDQVKDAKADRANLNRLKKALNDERLRREKEYMLPFNDFKSKVNEIIGIIDKPCAIIDKQIKDFEDKQKAEKLEAIKAIVDEIDFPVDLERVMDSKWLNSSVSLKAIKDALEAKKEQVLNDISVIDNLPEFNFEAKDFYLQSLDLALTMREVHRLQEQAAAKAAWEAEQAKKKEEAKDPKTEVIVPEEPVESVSEEPSRQWIGFQALLSKEEAMLLGKFLKEHGIKYKALCK